VAKKVRWPFVNLDYGEAPADEIAPWVDEKLLRDQKLKEEAEEKEAEAACGAEGSTAHGQAPEPAQEQANEITF